MTFDKDYPVIIDLARHIVRISDVDFDPEEVVSAVYIKLMDKPDAVYDYFSFEKEIYSYCKYQGFLEPEFIPYTDKWKAGKQHITFKQQRTCIECKQTKNASEFRLRKPERRRAFQDNKCITCCKKWRHEYNIINRERDRIHKANKRELNRDAVRKQNAIANEKAKNNLTDTYIKLVLKNKYSKEYIKENPAILEETRQRIIAKRKKKQLKNLYENRVIKTIIKNESAAKVIGKINTDAFKNLNQYTETLKNAVAKIKQKEYGKEYRKAAHYI